MESSTGDGNSFVKSTENSQNNEQQGLRYVRIAGEGEPEAYVREDYAELAQVRAVEPAEAVPSYWPQAGAGDTKGAYLRVGLSQVLHGLRHYKAHGKRH